MFKLKSTITAFFALAMIGGILAFAIRGAASRNADQSATAAVPTVAPAAAETPCAPIEAGRTTAPPVVADNLIAQAFRRRVIRGGTQNTALAGNVQIAGNPVAGTTVTLYAAGTGVPAKLVEGRTNGDGSFNLGGGQAPQGSVLYVVAKGGTPKAAEAKGPNDAIVLMALLGTSLPKKVTVNELTTVASTFTAARFINGESISGHSLGLRTAAGNAPNLVDAVTGRWGKVLLDPLNSMRTTTLASLDTLGSLISAYVTVANDDWRARFFKAATPPGGVTPKNTLEAMAGIAREPWAQAKELYGLFDEAYPQPKDGSRRSAPFVPYLAYVPDDFVLSLCFAGGGSYANGRIMFDADGNAWCGMNWMPGSQSGVNRNIGGGVGKFAPNGSALSPAITGFTGMGIDGIGWGTAVTKEHVWIFELQRENSRDGFQRKSGRN